MSSVCSVVDRIYVGTFYQIASYYEVIHTNYVVELFLFLLGSVSSIDLNLSVAISAISLRIGFPVCVFGSESTK